jgi:hypothetical protein
MDKLVEMLRWKEACDDDQVAGAAATKIEQLNERLDEALVQKCTSPFPDSLPCRGIQRERDEIKRIRKMWNVTDEELKERDTLVISQQAEIIKLKALLREWLDVTHPGPSRDLQLRTEKVLNNQHG